MISNKKIILVLFLVIFLVCSIEFISANQVNLSYDANGNLLQTDGEYYEYNSFNQLERVRLDNSSGTILSEYFYDADGARYKKVEYFSGATNETTYYVNENFVRIVNTSGTFDTVYYYDENTLVGRKDPNESVYYYHPDYIGSTSLVTSNSSQIVEENQYNPFGSVISGGASKYLFTGKEFDRESDIYYYGARYYDPYIGRFTQPDSMLQDPTNPQSLNRFSYALNNPLKYTDSSGHYIDTVFDIGSLAWSIHDLKQDPHSILNWVALAADIGTLALPVVAAGGTGVRALKVADKALETAADVNKAENVVDAGKIAEKGLEAIDAKNLPKEAQETIQKVGKGDISGLEPHTFKNKEGYLPKNSDPKYYTAYDVKAEGVSERGVDRLIIGKNGETYYTNDHYKTFSEVKS